jgi:hypothetical protein
MGAAEFFLRLLHTIFSDFLGAIAWPAVVLYLGVSNRGELRSFLSRLTKIGPTGAEAVPPQLAPTPPDVLSRPANTAAAPSSERSELQLSTNADPVLAGIENNIIRSLRERGQDKLPPERQKSLFIEEYAKLVLNSHFERLKLSIFGTQITALRYLNGNTAPLKSTLIPFYVEHVNKVNNRSLTDQGSFEIWFRFLIDSYLVQMVDAEHCQITDIGKKFINEYALVNNVNETTRLY